MREDGFNTGQRRIGTFFLWTIPLVLGLAASVWLGFFMGAHQWFNTLSQEERRAIYVGAKNAPKSPLKIVTPNEGCLKIDKVDLDGQVAAVYFHNSEACGKELGFIMLEWQLVSPDGTFLKSSGAYSSSLGGPFKLAPGGKGEAVFNGSFYSIETDKRAESIIFTITGQ